MLKLKKATYEDVSAIMEIINEAKIHLKSQGIEQWQTGYPDAECIRLDIEEGIAWLLDVDGETAGYVGIDFQGDPAYEKLKGQWLTIQPYVVIHRLAIDNAFKGRGLASEAFSLVEEMCLENDVFSIKVDTHPDNKTMQHLLDKNGYTYCGTVWFVDGDKIAYEKVLEK